jgi:hypothetical protein
MGVFLLIENEDGVIEAIVNFSPGTAVTISESHHGGAIVTEYPIEEGSTVTDHIVPMNEEFSFEAMVTNTPMVRDTVWNVGEVTAIKLDLPIPFDIDEIGPPLVSPGYVTRLATNSIEGRTLPQIKFANVLTFDDYDPGVEIYDYLTEVYSEGKVVQVYSSVRRYDDMVLTSLDMTRTPADGEGLRFALRFKKLKKVALDLVSAPKPVEPRGLPRASKGSQVPKKTLEEPTPNNESNKSLLKKLLSKYI